MEGYGVPIPEDVYDWWTEHKEQDRKREEQERIEALKVKKEAQKERLRAYVFARMTNEEREAFSE